MIKNHTINILSKHKKSSSGKNDIITSDDIKKTKSVIVPVLVIIFLKIDIDFMSLKFQCKIWIGM